MTLRLVRLESVDSTNREALERARAGAPHGLVVTAERQTAGRGRQRRSWFSPPGAGLFCSLIRRPVIEPAEAWRWTLIAGLAALRVARVATPTAWLKWPNDVLVGDRKVAGVLCELLTDTSRVDAVVMGIGLNLKRPPGGWPPELSGRASSLEELTAPSHCVPDVDSALLVLTDAVDTLEADLRSSGPSALMEEARRAMTPMFGRTVRVQHRGTTQSVTAVRMQDNGALEVVDEAGVVRPMLAGDVHLEG